MKIVHFLPYFDPTSKGGTETFICTLALQQVADGHTVSVLCPNTTDTTRRFDIDGLSYTAFPFPYDRHDQGFLAGLSRHPTNAAFGDIVHALDLDVVHLHGLYPFFLHYVERIAGASRPVLILTAHLMAMNCARHTLVDYRGQLCDGRVDFRRCTACVAADNDGPLWKAVAGRALMPISARLAGSSVGRDLLRFVPAHSRIEAMARTLDFMRDNVFVDALTPYMREVFLRNGFDAARVGSFDNPHFDPDTFVPAPRAAAARGPLRLAMVGRVSLEKGAGLLLDSLARLDGLKDRFTLAIAGRCTDPPLEARVEQARAAGFAIHLLGECDADEVAALYRHSDYLISASLPGREMLPLVIQEAFEAELPVIASDTLGARALVHEGLNGHLFRAGDADDLVRILQREITRAAPLRFFYRPAVSAAAGRARYYRDMYDALCRPAGARRRVLAVQDA